ncbi:MAG: sugar phosphate isomerase/epimerase [Proteobacteria bacterium]|nr:sugar phosphate isomerase/epimerase [Pseudomonadota bacterium]
MNGSRFGMDTITLAGPLEAKLRAVRAGGFSQIMLSARDIVGHPAGEDVAIAAVRESGLRVTGFQVLRDFEGLSGHLHDYKVDIAKAMLEMCHALGSRVLLICSSTSAHAEDNRDRMVADLRKLAMLAVPFGINVAYEALSWGRYVNEVPQAWSLVERADRHNLGLAIDSYHMLATSTPLEVLDEVDPARILFVQLADFMWKRTDTPDERRETARHFRVFPGEGVHSAQIAALMQRLDDNGYAGDYSFEVFNDDYVQLPLATVVERARRSVAWLQGQVPRRGIPLGSGLRPSPSAA